MTRTPGGRAQRRWLVPEVVQTSSMDCGPATLKCVLEGFGVPVSYGRLREACQTDVDGTSIDTLEAVANQLGAHAEQVMIPPDHVLLPGAATLPAVVVVRHADGATHFVVVWRRHGPWLQVMDPAIGRRWVRSSRFADEMFRHEMSVPAAEWRHWAATDAFIGPLRQRMSMLAIPHRVGDALIDRATADTGWFTAGALDACVRLVTAIVEAGGIDRGRQAAALLGTLFERTRTSTNDIFRAVPSQYWSVTPDPASPDRQRQHLILRGAVLLHIGGVTRPAVASTDDAPATGPALSPELAAALREKPARPLHTLWGLLREDGLLAPIALVGAIVIAVGAIVLEALLFRGLFDIADVLHLPEQRLAAALGLLTFVSILLCFEIPIAMESLRLGRHLEARLRVALLRKLPHLSDRYFQSRPVSDMADRSHSIQLARAVPGLGIQCVQATWELLLTLAGILCLDPGSGFEAIAIVVAAFAVPIAFQPVINERDLRLRIHSGALNAFYLDALLGLVPIRTHGAEPAVRRQHEGLLVEWARSSRGLLRLSITAQGLQALVCLGIASHLLVEHFVRAGGVSGGDLLLVYWTLKLPAIGGRLMSLAQQYPAQRNVLLRLIEPLAAPEDTGAATRTAGPRNAPPDSPVRSAVVPGDAKQRVAVSIEILQGSVVAAGHTILRDMRLRIAPGEHVAIVGPSGAGKSTLVGLLLGWHRLSQGELRIDRRPMASADQVALRRDTAWVDPGIQLWNRSFLDNLAYASEDESPDLVGPAIDAGDLRTVLRKLPHGLQTYLGEGGSLLSGGEGQRVRLARALLQSDVRLVLLDEPFRGLDREQRSRLLADARRWWQDVTLLCVTHDVRETLPFDRVLVVDDGRILEDGVPAQLAASMSRYRMLLDAEELVRRDLWKGAQWRRIRIDNGTVREST